MKVIFLDIDGVIAPFPRSFAPPPERLAEIWPECVVNLNRIIAATKADIVLSSSWRYLIFSGSFNSVGFSKLLHSHGVKGAKFLGTTRRDEGDEPRSAQIADWIRENAHGQLESYCIIDDDPDAFGGRPGIQVDGCVGLTESDAVQAIAILNRHST